MADTPEQPDIPETAFTAPVAAAYPSSESNGAATATPLTETLRTTTLGGAEWQKSLASLESPGATPTEPTAPAPGRRVPPKMIALAVTLASMAVLGAMLKRSRARRTSAD